MRFSPGLLTYAGALSLLAAMPPGLAAQGTIDVTDWGFVSAGGFAVADSSPGNLHLSATAPSQTSGQGQLVFRAAFGPLGLTAGDSISLTGSMEISTSVDGGPLYLGWSHGHFGLFNSRGQTGTLSEGAWTGGAENGYSGYMLILSTAASGPSSPWGQGGNGSLGALLDTKTNAWYDQGGATLALGGAFQEPAQAGISGGVHDFNITITRIGPYLTQVDYLFENQDGTSYILQDTVYDDGVNPDGTTVDPIYDTVGFRFNDSRFTDLTLTNVQVTLTPGNPNDPNNLYDFETDSSGWVAYQVEGEDQAVVGHEVLEAGTVNDLGALAITVDEPGLVWAATTEIPSSEAAYETIYQAYESSIDLDQYAIQFDVTLLTDNAGGYTGDVDFVAALVSGDSTHEYGSAEEPLATATWDANKMLTVTIPLSPATIDPEDGSLGIVIGVGSEATAAYKVLVDNVRVTLLDPTPELRMQVASKNFGNVAVDEVGYLDSPQMGWLWVGDYPYVYCYNLEHWRGSTSEYKFGWLWTYGDFEEDLWCYDYYLNKWFYTRADFWPWAYIYDDGWTYMGENPDAGIQPYVLSPDTLKLMDGTPVDTPELWETRRAEILEALSDVMYGHLPEEKPTMVLTPADPVESSTYWTHNIVVDMTVGETTVSTTMVVRIPKTATAENPVPVMMTPEPYGQYYQGTYLTGGWAGAGVNFGEFAPDNSTARTGKFYQLYGDDVDTGGLLVWAWCYHRLIDVLEEMAFPGIDLTKIAVTGHSRYGKCALLAGAYDERVTLTAPSHSGAAGAGPYKTWFGTSEPLSATAGGSGHWLSPAIQAYVDDVQSMPIDAHLLVSAVAPRGLVQIEGTLDSGTNPEGSQLSYQEALRVYTMLGVPEKAGLRFRPVGHVGNDGDVLAFGNYLWNGAALPEGFNFLPYAIEPAQPANE